MRTTERHWLWKESLVPDPSVTIKSLPNTNNLLAFFVVLKRGRIFESAMNK